MSAWTSQSARPAARAGRSLHAICQTISRVACDRCDAGAHHPCSPGGPGPDGYHLTRFARARRMGLLTEADVFTILTVAGPALTVGTLVRDGAW